MWKSKVIVVKNLEGSIFPLLPGIFPFSLISLHFSMNCREEMAVRLWLVDSFWVSSGLKLNFEQREDLLKIYGMDVGILMVNR